MVVLNRKNSATVYETLLGLDASCRRSAFKNLSQKERKVCGAALKVLAKNGSSVEVEHKKPLSLICTNLMKTYKRPWYALVLSLFHAIGNLFGRVSSKALLSLYQEAEKNLKRVNVPSKESVPLKRKKTPVEKEPLVVDKQKKSAKSVRKLVPLDANDVNVIHKDLTRPLSISSYAKNISYYPYNAEGIRDVGWGCAWRTLQLCLSGLLKEKPVPSFKDLFLNYGKKETLIFLYKKARGLESVDYMEQGVWAPHDLGSGWAEPFIAEMAIKDLGFKASLETVYGVPGFASAPKEVFQGANHHSFSAFVERLEKHFKKNGASAVMIDDAIYTLGVLGVGTEGNNVTLWIADPHVRSGLGKKSKVGVYTVSFNEKGKQMKCSLSDKQRKLFALSGFAALSFVSKPWMVLFPEKS